MRRKKKWLLNLKSKRTCESGAWMDVWKAFDWFDNLSIVNRQKVLRYNEIVSFSFRAYHSCADAALQKHFLTSTEVTVIAITIYLYRK